jgi:hypothetical protein
MGWMVNATPRPLYPEGKTWYLLCRRLGESQGRSGRVRKISPPPPFDTRKVQPVASRYTDWVIPKAKFMHSSNHTEQPQNKITTCFISCAQTKTVLQPYAFLTGIRQSLITNKGPLTVSSANECKGRLKTLRSLSVLCNVSCLATW